MSLPADGGLDIGELELDTLADVEINPTVNWESKIGVIERLVNGEPPMVTVEVYGDWGEVNAVISIEDARRFRDRLNEVIAVAEEAAE